MAAGCDANKVAEAVILLLARYKYYLVNDSKDVTIISNLASQKQANDTVMRMNTKNLELPIDISII